MADSREPADIVEIKPCRHMERWVNALSDGSLTGWARWYTRLHVAGCRQCRSALEAIETLRERLREMRDRSEPGPSPTLSPQRRQALEAALAEVEKKLPEK